MRIYPVTQVYIKSLFAVKSILLLWFGMQQAGLLLPHRTPRNEAPPSIFVSVKKKVESQTQFLNSTFTVTLQDDLQTDLCDFLFREIKYHLLCTRFCLLVSGSEERRMKGLTGPQRAFHSTDSHRQILYVCESSYLRVRNVVLKDKKAPPLFYSSMFCDGGAHALCYGSRGDNSMCSDSSVKHKKWLLALSDAAGFTQSKACKGAWLSPSNM